MNKMAEGRSAVRPIVTLLGRVVCSECSESMSPEEYRAIIGHEAQRPWLLWRCRGPEKHVSEMLPLP